jgi:diadenylate cyclase
VIQLRPIIEIFILFLAIYGVFRFLRGTRGLGILKGLGTIAVVLIIALVAVSNWLPTIHFIFQRALPSVVIALIILFQPELRRGLMRLGQNPLVEYFMRSESKVIEQVAKAATRLSKQKIGALIAIEREIGIGTYIEGGVIIDAEVNSNLIETIFWPGSTLHDGAIAIRNNRIAAAGCLFPLSDNPEISRRLGTRHRAAIGLTEESDAISVVVSEETGQISACYRGKIHQDLGPEGLEEFLRKHLMREEKSNNGE